MKLFTEIINKLRNKRKKLVELSEVNEPEEEKQYNVNLSKEGNFYKLDLGEDLSLGEYCEIIKKIDVYSFDAMLNILSMYDGVNNLVRKGTYYVFEHNGKTYNIVLLDSKIVVFRKEQFEEYSETIDIIRKIESNTLILSILRHDKNGSTYYYKYYCTRDISSYPENWIISYEEAKDTINMVLDDLGNTENINQIFDVESFRKTIFGMMEEFNNKGLKRERINQ